jgi:putative oxidoreductase
MNILKSAPRVILGLIYVIFGINGFLQFLPMPELPEAAGSLMGAFMMTGYMLPFIKITEIAGGLLLLSGCRAALGVIVLAPITLNILFFHMFLTPGISNLAMPIVMIALQLEVTRQNWGTLKPLFCGCTK